MQVARSVAEFLALRANMPKLQTARRVGFVPTMGFLHRGHVSLVAAALRPSLPIPDTRAPRGDCDAVVASIFVNPTQFGPNEDLAKYPRALERDLELFAEAGVDLVLAPADAGEMYPAGYTTYVTLDGLETRVTEAAARPGHFRGVATVVSKLFNLVRPHAAYFGQKDAMQCVVLRRMVRDLNYQIDVEVCPTLRESDGLAMSSRNSYLSPAERALAPIVYRSLQAADELFSARGEARRAPLLEAAQHVLAAAAGPQAAELQYLSLADRFDGNEVERIDEQNGAVLSIAVKVGSTRLIDNIELVRRQKR